MVAIQNADASVMLAEGSHSRIEVAVWKGQISMTVQDTTYESAMVRLTREEAHMLAHHLLAAAGPQDETTVIADGKPRYDVLTLPAKDGD